MGDVRTPPQCPGGAPTAPPVQPEFRFSSSLINRQASRPPEVSTPSSPMESRAPPSRRKRRPETSQSGIMGGASIGQQYLAAGLVDVIDIHLVQVLFGSGTRMFEDHQVVIMIQ